VKKEMRAESQDLRDLLKVRDKTRLKMRETNRDLDIFLFRFGYTNELRHPENQFAGAEAFYRMGKMTQPYAPQIPLQQ
jgi:hypothetical protein